MAYHIDENGIAHVTPVTLFNGNGIVSHPLQRLGQIAHLPDGNGVIYDHNQGHPYFGGTDRTKLKI